MLLSKDHILKNLKAAGGSSVNTSRKLIYATVSEAFSTDSVSVVLASLTRTSSLVVCVNLTVIGAA